MNGITLLGLTAGTLTTLSFLPQVIQTWKTKSAKDISLGMFCALTLGIMLWLVYGILTADIPLIAANLVSLVFSVIILVLKLRYR